MKLIKFFTQNRVSILSMLLMVLAVCFGADASMAMADAATEATNAANNTGSINDTKGISTQLPNTAASATQIRDGELAWPEIDKRVAEFIPFRFTLDTDVRLKCIQQPVKSYEIKHYRNGTAVLDFNTTSAITNNVDMSSSVNIFSKISADAKKSIAKDMLLYFDTVVGYDGANADGNGLLVQVTGKTSDSILIEALNGPLNNGEMYVPNIASGSHFALCSNALSESQMQCEPENYQPRPVDVYLQKHASNIVITDHWKEIEKQVPFVETDIRNDALYKFRRKKERLLWIGVKTKRKRYQNNTMGSEYVYTSKGILKQIQKLYGLGDAITFSDLVRLTKMQFTEYSMSDKATAYCGKNFMEKLLNIDFTKHKDVSFTRNTVMGIDIRSFVTTFGTLDFVYNPTLNDIGLSDYCVILDMEHAVRYYKQDKDYSIDMKKGAGENREAKRDVHIEIDAVALKGYNSILVGPSGKLLGIAGSDATITFTTAASLPASPTDGQIVLLSAADDGFDAGSLLVYSAATTSWTTYVGDFEA